MRTSEASEKLRSAITELLERTKEGLKSVFVDALIDILREYHDYLVEDLEYYRKIRREDPKEWEEKEYDLAYQDIRELIFPWLVDEKAKLEKHKEILLA